MDRVQKVLPIDLQRLKEQRRKITMLSIYDYALAILADRAGLDTILVGDSLAMTALGYPSTVAVSLEEMLHHTRAVGRGAKRAMVIADMPFMSYQVSAQEAVRNAGRFLQEAGADAVKLEGGRAIVPTLKAVYEAGVPVIGHIGLTPQNAAQLGGLKVQGGDAAAGRRLLQDALALEQAGAFAVILECVPREVARIITARLRVPTISYGAGVYCDGQGMVSADMLGLFEQFTPRFAKRYVDLATQISGAFKSYCEEVIAGQFPDDKHSYGINAVELEKLEAEVRRP
ncbi:MAG TPA: 3-methyl-2-oxobutanoate hydroxymethyltransferase [Hyphomicrobiaceae bacterium]|nr:3-methyl-2-oxobutanoate hydroxymethyltransferase [Hyphomicrobiaceae bacterium]